MYINMYSQLYKGSRASHEFQENISIWNLNEHSTFMIFTDQKISWKVNFMLLANNLIMYILISVK